MSFCGRLGGGGKVVGHRPAEGSEAGGAVRQDEVVHAAFLEHGDGDLLHLLYSPGTHRLDQRVPFGEALGARQGFLFVNPEEAVETLQVVLDVLLKLVQTWKSSKKR